MKIGIIEKVDENGKGLYIESIEDSAKGTFNALKKRVFIESSKIQCGGFTFNEIGEISSSNIEKCICNAFLEDEECRVYIMTLDRTFYKVEVRDLHHI